MTGPALSERWPLRKYGSTQNIEGRELVLSGEGRDKELIVDLRLETEGLHLGRQGSKCVKEADTSESHALKAQFQPMAIMGGDGSYKG